MKKYFTENKEKIIFFIFLFILHLNMKPGGDDISIAKKLTANGLLSSSYAFTVRNYQSWMPTVFHVYVTFFLTHCNIWVWKVINIFISFALAHFLKIVFLDSYKDKGAQLCAYLMFFLYPLLDQNTAGWLSTTPRYLWVASGLLIAIVPLKKILKNEEISSKDLIISYLSTIYVTNVEQGFAILFSCLLFFAGYFYCINKKYNFLFIQLTIALINSYYLLTSPGNAKRYFSEIVTWYPQYADYTVIERLYIGLSSTIVNRFFLNPNWYYIFFVIVVILIVIKKKEVSYKKYRYLFLLYFLTIFRELNLFPNFFKAVMPVIIINKTILTGNFDLINPDNWNQIINYIGVLYVFMIPVIIILGIYYSFDNLKEKSLFILIFLAGLMSRVMMGLSPTVYASSTRTFTFFDLSMMIIVAVLFMKCLRYLERYEKWYLWIFLIIISFMNYLELLFKIK